MIIDPAQISDVTPYDPLSMLARADWHDEQGQADLACLWRRRGQWADLLWQGLVMIDPGASGYSTVLPLDPVGWNLTLEKRGSSRARITLWHRGGAEDHGRFYREVVRCSLSPGARSLRKLLFGLVETACRVDAIGEGWPGGPVDRLFMDRSHEGRRVAVTQGIAEWFCAKKVPFVAPPRRIQIPAIDVQRHWYVPFGASSLLRLDCTTSHVGFVCVTRHVPDATSASSWREHLLPAEDFRRGTFSREEYDNLLAINVYAAVVTTLHYEWLNNAHGDGGATSSPPWAGMPPEPREHHVPGCGPWKPYPTRK